MTERTGVGKNAAQLTRVLFSRHSVFESVSSSPEMQNEPSKTGRGVTVNGSVSTLQRQQWPKSPLTRQDRGSCSSTSSCPVFSAHQRDPDKVKPPRCPSSLSSPTLQNSLASHHGSGHISSHRNSYVSLKSSASSLEGSLPRLQGSDYNLKSFKNSSPLQSSKQSLRSSTTSFCSSTSSFRSSSSSLQSGSSSEDNSWDTNSWSSGATCLLRSSIKQHSEEVFRVRASSGSRPEPASDSEAIYQNLDSCQGTERQPESQQTAEKVPVERKDSLQSRCSTVASSASLNLEEKIQGKLKFSQFLDEVTFRVLDPESLQAFGALRQKDTPVSSPQSCSHTSSNSYQHKNQKITLNEDSTFSSSESKMSNSAASVYKWNKSLPTCKVLDTTEALRMAQEESFRKSPKRTYLETDIDSTQIEDELSSTEGLDGKREYSRQWERERRNVFGSSKSQKNVNAKKCVSAVSVWSEGFPKNSHHPTSLHRPASSNLVSDVKTHPMSSVQEQKEDLQKRLSYTTHKLEMLESEFDSTRQYLEAELLRAQVELEKCTEKLNRVQNSYEVLQRMNQNLEDKTQELKLQYEEEKRALSQEIIILNNHLMEAKITIEKLKEDNELYRKDCNLATQLLLCGKFNHKAHKLSELPTDFKKRVSSHIEKQGYARNKGLCDTPYSDMVPAAVIAKPVKPEPGNSCPVTHSSSPHSRDLVLTNNGIDISNTHHRHVISKSSDLYCSDTALYCPSDERPQSHWQQRRQSVDLHDRETNVPQVQNSIESHPEKGKFHSNNAVPFHGITTGSPPASSFTLASNDNCNTPSSTLSSSHLSLCRDWKEGDYNRKSTSSFDKTTPAFPKSHSVQHKATNLQKCNSPAYRRTAPCYSEPYHSPQLSSSLGMASSGFPIEAPSSFPISEEEMTGHWKQLSVEDINTLPYCSLGYVSPYCFSEQHFVMGPTAPLYSSFQEGNDNFHTHAFDPYFPTSPGSNLRPSPKHSLGLYNTEKGLMSQPNDACIGVKTSLLPQGTSKDMENTAGAGKKEVANANNSESLHKQGEATKYQNKGPQKKTHPQYQTFGTRGLSRKDSLTKAQLYGTLLN